MKPGKAIGVALLACALIPASVSASTVQVTPAGDLRLDGALSEANQVTIRYRPADRAGFGSVADRLVVEDKVGIQGASPGCLPINPTVVSCDASPVTAIAAGLGDGDDTLTVIGEVPARLPATAFGGEGNDVIRGGSGRDRLFGEAGRDVVAGWKADDLLSGGPGIDALIGFTGNDKLIGGADPDVLFAQKGNDRLIGGPGRDILSAKDGFRDPVINCGPGGRQSAITDPRDPDPRGCGKPPKKGA